MTPESQYAMGMAQVLATLVVAVAVIGRRTSTRPLQSAQSVLHFLLGTFGLVVLTWDVLVASDSDLELFSSWLLLLNVLATISLLMLMYALAPFFQTKAEKRLEAEAQQINRDRDGAGTKPSTAGGTEEQIPAAEAQKVLPTNRAAQGQRQPKTMNRRNQKRRG
jgi:hypothetical protein